MGRPRRIATYPYVGVQRYFVTACTRDRAQHFTSHEAVALTVDALVATATERAITIVVYMAMPDHLHMLVDGDHQGSDFTTFMKVGKQRAGFRFKQRFRQHLWQEGYHERVLRNAEKTEDVVSYIIANPLRKHLVQNVLEYPHWGSMRYTREELVDWIAIPRRT